jgi:hypothetical protein
MNIYALSPDKLLLPELKLNEPPHEAQSLQTGSMVSKNTVSSTEGTQHNSKSFDDTLFPSSQLAPFISQVAISFFYPH